MSNEDNAKQSEENIGQEQQQLSTGDSSNSTERGETAEKQQESQSSPSKPTEGNAKKLSGVLSSILKIKEENPKVFYGGIGGGVLLLLIIMFSGGDNGVTSGPAMKNLVIGQRYVLKSPNVADTTSTVRLVAVPGTIAAYDDTEEDDRMGGCKHMLQGTSVTVLGLQDAYGKKNAFANIKIETEGECKGTTAWTLSINVQ